MMDRIIDKPPAMLLHPVRGAPRNRAELIRRLVEFAVDQATKEKQ